MRVFFWPVVRLLSLPFMVVLGLIGNLFELLGKMVWLALDWFDAWLNSKDPVEIGSLPEFDEGDGEKQ
jgi:hypothetical protein